MGQCFRIGAACLACLVVSVESAAAGGDVSGVRLDSSLLTGAQLQSVDPLPAPLPKFRNVDDGPPEDFRIIEIRLRQRRVLAADVIGYERKTGIVLPLAETLFALGFPVEIDTKSLDATGWFLREAQGFEIRATSGTARVADRVFSFDPPLIEVGENELYVPLSLLSDWFILDAEWEADRQVVNLNPPYLLADEEAARRSATSGRARGGDLVLDPSLYAPVSSGPGLFGWPLGSVRLGVSHLSGSDSQTRGDLSLSLRGDLLGFTGDLSGTMASGNEPSFRLALSRQDAAGGLLGPLRASQISLGDISVQSAPLIGASATGLGFSISRETLQRGSNFDTTRIEGDALSGWQAELYRDGQLLSFMTVPTNGRYVFDNVDLIFGANRFTVELYGPAGERRSVERSINVSDAFLAPGRFEYALEAVDVGRQVFGRDNLEPPTPNASDRLRPQTQAQMRFGYGVTPWLTLAGALAQDWQEGRTISPRMQLGAALRTGRVLWTIDAAHDGDQAGFGFGSRSDLGAVSLSLSAERYQSGFETARSGEGLSQLTSRAEMRLDGRALSLWQGQTFNWSAGAGATERLDGGSDVSVDIRLGSQIGGVSVNQAISWRSVTASDGQVTDRSDATLSAAGQILGVRGRARVDIELGPESRMRQVALDLTRRDRNWAYGLRYEADFDTDKQNAGITVSRDWNGVRLGLDIRHDTTGESQIQLSLSFDVDRAPDGGLRMGRAARSSRGAALVRVFHDVDRDGKFGPGDQKVQIARVDVVPRARQSVMGDGRVLIEDLTTDRQVGIRVDPDALADPYLAPAGLGARFTPRSAGIVLIDLPVIETGEIEWLLTSMDGRPREGAIANLSRCGEDQPYQRERAAFDGAVLFQFVPPGCWLLTASGSQAVSLTLEAGEIVRLKGAPE